MIWGRTSTTASNTTAPPSPANDPSAWYTAADAFADAASATGRRAVVVATLAECINQPFQAHLVERGITALLGLGEALTARFLDSSAIRLDLDRIDYAPADRARLLRFLESPWGLFISTGPTGSGKSTALYACLNRCIKPGVKVISVEDPVEYLLPGMTQIPVNPALGVTFPAAMRAVLRCDPDIIMCGDRHNSDFHQSLSRRRGH